MKRVKDPNIAQYCCAAYDGRVSLISLNPNPSPSPKPETNFADFGTCAEQSPLWAAVSCTKITPLVRIDFFLRDEPLLHLEDFLK